MVQMYSNATPNAYFPGYKDSPKKGVQKGAVQTPLHCALSFIFAEWGTMEDALYIAGGEAITQYGAETWKETSPYFTHGNLFANLFLKNANGQFVLRMDAPGSKVAGARLFLEVVAADVTNWERNADGSYKLDADGNKTDLTTTTTGYKLRLKVVVSDDGFVIGGGVQADGTLVGSGSTSTLYPIMDVVASHKGQRGSRLGFNIFQPKTTNPQPVSAGTIDAMGSMLYRMAISESPKLGGTNVPWYTQNSKDAINFGLDPMLMNEYDVPTDFDSIYKDGYTLTGQPSNGLNESGPVDSTHVYNDNIAIIAGLLHTAELTVTDNQAHIVADNVHSINILDNTDHRGIPYGAIEYAGVSEYEVDTYRAVEGSVAKLGNGADGDMSTANLDAAVSALMDNFGKTGITLKDMARYPFHCIYDTGYSSETTMKLLQVMSIRPDVMVLTSTFEDGAPLLSVTDEMAVAGQIATAAALQVESAIYKTPSTRASICPWAISLPNSQYRHPVTLNYEIADKLSKMLGAGDGIWDTNQSIDVKNVINATLLNYEYAELTVREGMWENQMIAVEYSDLNSVIFSGLQTVNPNDSSVLNSLVGVFGCIHATWACYRAHKKYVGRNMTNDLLVQESNKTITELVSGVDASKVIIKPNTYFSPEDLDAGYAHVTGADVYIAGMQTVSTIQINSHFMDELV